MLLKYLFCVRTQRYGLFFKNQNKLYICIEKIDFLLNAQIVQYNKVRTHGETAR
ncbi:hypothetical protein BACPLE_00832 [Phocaeicola plebeius DSM 17135]|uniref:Uncharacterized protein n=1 Tax=Phocaeicola plebeius (strain DSM 17135 / JCM 12973 / CCUG 54634 / M2) TaxID=484018 RepID=B5CVU5_PHOPM|nr:hypothetical protein BACPLE_00832 [Phocaeicola plebeius DSM 17135]